VWRIDEGFEICAGFGRGGVGRDSTQRISDNIFFTGLVFEGSTKFINEDTPAEHTLSVELGEVMGQVLVVTVDYDLVSKEESAAFLESFDNTGSVVLLGWG